MKIYALLLIALYFAIPSYGQLNPINNLTWEHNYIFPPGLNTFSLTWETPDVSSDTLIGYNIYGGDSLWRFQTSIGAFCNEFECPDGDFINDFLTEGDYIKVTAVYNNSFEESTVIDSVQFFGLLVGITENSANSKTKLYPNPTTGIITIETDIDFRIELLDVSGNLIHEQSTGPIIDMSEFSKGVYFVKIITSQGISINRIILQ